jgi:hypothetical protein
MNRLRHPWLIVFVLLFVVGLSITATIAVLEMRKQAENPLMPPPVARTVALREVISAPGANGDPEITAPASNTPIPEGVVVVDRMDDPPVPADEPPPPAEPQTDFLGLPQIQGLAVDFPGKDGPQRVEDARPVTERAGFTSPRWSPLGIDLAMVRTARRELFIQAPLPGQPPRFVMRLPQSDTKFQWNDDGMTLRVQHPGLGGWVEVLLTGEIYPSSPPASPVVVASGRIILIPSFPGAQPVLLSPPGDVYDQPLLSPDGAWVSFQGKESGVYLASLRTNLIWRIGPGRDEVWMPDSSGLVFSRSIDDLQGPVGGDLWLATVDGRHLTNLTRSPGVRESQPDIAPDGERVAFVRDGAVFVGVYRSNEEAPFEPLNSSATDPSMPDPDADPSSNEATMPNTGESLLR